MKYELHPACKAWPEMLAPELAELADDIRDNGLREPITLTPDDLLLDGRIPSPGIGIGEIQRL